MDIITRLALNINKKLYYGWFIALNCLVFSIALFGLRFTFGVFFKSVASDFDLNRFATSSINSAFMLFSVIFSLIAGWALDKFGPRLVICFMGFTSALSMILTSQVYDLWQVYFTYSFVLAIGTGGAMPVVTAIVSKWFDKKRGQAIGLAAMGGGLGTVITAPIAAFLIASLTWRESYIYLGIIGGTIIIILSLFLLKSPLQLGMLPDGLKQPAAYSSTVANQKSAPHFSFQRALHSVNFWIIFTIWVLYSSCLIFLLVHCVPFVTDIGMSTQEAAAMLSVMGITGIVSRFVGGKLSDTGGRKILAIFGAGIMAAGIILLILFRNHWILYITWMFVGAGWGIIGVSLLTLSTDIYRGQNIGIIMGALEVGFLLGSAIGPAIAGYIFDTTGKYDFAFVLAALAMFLVIMLITLINQNRDKVKNGGLPG